MARPGQSRPAVLGLARAGRARPRSVWLSKFGRSGSGKDGYCRAWLVRVRQARFGRATPVLSLRVLFCLGRLGAAKPSAAGTLVPAVLFCPRAW